MNRFLLLIALFLLIGGSTYAQDIYFNAYTNRVITTNGTTAANLPVPTNGDRNDYVELTSYQYGFSNSTTVSAGGTGAGKAVPTAIELTKRLDVSSVFLQNALLAGQRLQTAQIVLRGTGATPRLITVIELKNAFVSSFNTSAGSGGDCCPPETVQLTYTAIRITNYQQSTTGAVTAQSPQVVWNFATNTADF